MSILQYCSVARLVWVLRVGDRFIVLEPLLVHGQLGAKTYGSAVLGQLLAAPACFQRNSAQACTCPKQRLFRISRISILAGSSRP